MAINFNLDDILGMAEQIERNGGRFYKMAAAKSKNERVKELFLQLAAWESSHEKIFQKMRAELKPNERGGHLDDPNGDNELYLQSMADMHVFTKDQNATAESERGLLELALKFEGDSILFFVGMKQLVPAYLGKEKIDMLIEEETRHIAFLRRQIIRLEKGEL